MKLWQHCTGPGRPGQPHYSSNKIRQHLRHLSITLNKIQPHQLEGQQNPNQMTSTEELRRSSRSQNQNLVAGQQSENTCHRLNGQTLLEFSHFQDLDKDGSGVELRVKSATLWVKVDFRASLPRAFRHSLQDRNLTLWLFKVTRPPAQLHLSGKEFDEYTEMAASLPATLSALGWLKFDLTQTVRDWYSSGASSRERLRLLVDCSGCGDLVEAVLFRQPTLPYVQIEEGSEPSSFKIVGDSFQSEETSDIGNSKDSKDTQRPFLVIHTDPTATRRVRRRALNCSGAEKVQCCKEQFYVSFKQLGWEDWIIAPRGYYANYCRGDCGGVHRTPDTFLYYYTHVIEEYRKMGRLSGIQPCCAPTKFSSMSLIYFGPDSNIIKRDLPKMIVDECGCP
ncbi:inhibin beta chain isoform X2 [Anabrus simplex]|uniref:inhibin beta chain isoform X2 n=1 Tax=Anabrus simplex TaxID=316456 RepID=UPI0034DD5804